MTNFLVTIIIAIGLISLTGWGAMELFQSARDSYDQQMLSLRLEQVGAAVKSSMRVIDGLPTLPAPITTGTYPTLPPWVSANAKDTNGHAFVYCPYALRPAANIEGTAATVTGPGYNIITYTNALFGSNNPIYVVGSDKPALYATTPNTGVTPGATSGYGITFTAGSGVFSASNVGQMITSGSASAVITGFTNSTHVVATITQNFPSTGTISSGNWKISSVAPKGLLGFILAFKPHDTYNATTAATWCNNVQLTATGGYSTVGAVNALIYPIIVGQSQYQQAYAKTDNVTYYAAPSASGDGTGRNPSNQATLQSIMSQLAVLHPARVTVYLAAGTHNVTLEDFDQAYEPSNLRGLTVTLDGTGNNPTISLSSYVGSATTNARLDWPVNLILRNLTLSRTDSSTIGGANISIDTNNLSTDTKWVFDGVTDNVPTYVNNNLWVRGSTFNNILQIIKNGKMFVNGTTTTNVVTNAGNFQVLAGELNILPGASLNYSATTRVWQNGYNNPILTIGAGSSLNISGTGAGTPSLTITTATGTQTNAALGVDAGGVINMNNATLSIGSGSSTVAGFTGRNVKGIIFVSGEMHLNNSSILFPQGVTINVAAIDLVEGGKFTMHNGSVIGSSSTASQRPFYGVYDDGGTFVGGSSTGYSSGASGEGGSPPSNIYVQNSAGAQCWAGSLWPSSPASGSSAQQRHLFLDSPEGNGTTSAPRGTNNSFVPTSLSLVSPTIATGVQVFSVFYTGQAIPIGAQVSIVSKTNASNYMSGYVMAYSNINSGTANYLTVNVTSTGGSGTLAANTTTVAGGFDLRHLVLANQTNWVCNNPSTAIASPSAASMIFASNTASPSWCLYPYPYVTETILPSGYNSSAAISISDVSTGSSPAYSLDGGNTWSSSAGTIAPNNTLTVKLNPSTGNSGTAQAQVTIGGTTYPSITVNTTSSCYSIGPVGGTQQASATMTNGTTMTATLPAGTTANNLIVIAISDENPTSLPSNPAASDDKTNPYIYLSGQNGGGSGNVLATTSFYAKRVKAGTQAFTVSFSGTVANAAMIVTEYPITDVSPYDKGSATANSTGTSGLVPAQPGELLIGVHGSYSATGMTITNPTPSSHFITVSTGSGLTLAQSDGVLTTTASASVGYTDTGTSPIRSAVGWLFK